MAKISLRAYNREIEKLIDHGQTKEASAHCKYILKIFPKHIDTYRLLGKTYLESQRYSEAADILQRVLAVVPDDFVAQIGLSIIREDEGNLDAAIWNMERAFEVQPSNAAVQDELRRLYGNRDGVEPPRVRLTRGALVRMYTRGELYQQAIAETRAALAEAPKRTDLEVLLARNYYLSNNYVDATEICSRLVKKMPYCYEANWILSEILPSTNKSEEAKVFAKRVQELDPYAAFTDRATPNSSQVPEDVVTLEKLEWRPSLENTEQPQWAKSIGIEIDSQTDQPADDWISDMPDEGADSSAPMPFIIPEISESKSEDVLPDWMKKDGWTSGDETEKPDEEQKSNAFILDKTEDLEEAEIPEWLQSMAPEEIDQGQPSVQSSEIPPTEPQQAPGAPDWMAELDSGNSVTDKNGEKEAPIVQPESSQKDNLPDWLQDLGSDSADDADSAVLPTPSTEADFPELPDSDTEGISPVAETTADRTPDWLKDLENPNQETPEQSSISSPEAEIPEQPAQESELPDWLSDLEPEAAQAPQLSETPAELDGALAEMISGLPADDLKPQETNPEISESADAIPDWLKEFDSDEDTNEPEVKTVPVQEDSPSSESDLPDWLKAFSDETPVDGAPDSEPQPDASTLSSAVEDTLPSVILGAAAELGDENESTDQDVSKQEEQGPAPSKETEEWLDASAQPAQEIPDWLSDLEPEAAASSEPQVTPNDSTKALKSKLVEETQSDEIPENADDAFAWLESLAAKHGAEEEALSTPPEERDTSVPDWLQDLGEAPQETEKVEGEQPLQAQTTQETPLPQDEVPELPVVESKETPQESEVSETLPDWLSDLGQEGTSQPTASETIDEVLADLPAEAVQIESPLQEEPQTEPEPAVREAETSLPDWLQSQDEPIEQVTPAAKSEVLPDWLEDLKPEETKLASEIEEVASEPQPAPTLESDQIEEVKEIPSPADLGSVDADDAFAWLESLAAKHGAEEEALVTSSEERLETPPDWVQDLSAEEVAQPAEDTAIPDTLSISDLDTGVDLLDSATDTLESTPETEDEEAKAQEWLQSLASGKPMETSAPTNETTTTDETVPTDTSESDGLPLPGEMETPKQEEELVTNEPAEVEAETVAEMEIPPAVEESSQTEQPQDSALPDWLKEFEKTPATEPLKEPEPQQQESQDETVIRWLHNLEEEETPTPAEEEQPKPAAEAPESETTEIQTAIEPTAEESAPEPREIVEEPVVEENVPETQDVIGQPAVEEIAPETAEEPAQEITQVDQTVEKTSPEAVLKTKPITETESAELPLTRASAQELLNKGKIKESVAVYKTLIKEEDLLDSVIVDLNDALIRHPVDTVLWLTLGDAYMQKKELQSALSAYSKAEELLR